MKSCLMEQRLTKVTPEEAKRITDAEKSGFVSESEIDWDSIGTES